jgi:hypothetical protein
MSRGGVRADKSSWNVVIGEYALTGEITVSILKACSLSGSLRIGKEIHCYVFRH